VHALFHDGRTSRQREVSVSFEPPDRVRVAGDGIDFNCALAAMRVSTRIGNTRRRLRFPDGSECETEDNDAVDELCARSRAKVPGRLLHRWESRLGYVALALALAAASLWGGVMYGIPAVARQVAFRLPVATERGLGEKALDGLDRTVFQPTRLPPRRQAELKSLFAGMTATIEGARGYRLELRASNRMGANALALPSGIIVVTDALVELARSDDELVAVLAHEIGHLRQRHALRALLQNSGTALVLLAISGDLGSMWSVANAPAVLLQSRYSREFEREADDFALAYLRGRGIPPDALANLLLRIEQQPGAAELPTYLSTHPSTRERITRARTAH
jgi:Zn-dependent protease with chaperone function